MLLEACLATHRENQQGVVVGGGAPGGFPNYTGKTSSRLDGCKQCVSWEGVGVKDGMGGGGEGRGELGDHPYVKK